MAAEPHCTRQYAGPTRLAFVDLIILLAFRTTDSIPQSVRDTCDAFGSGY